VPLTVGVPPKTKQSLGLLAFYFGSPDLPRGGCVLVLNVLDFTNLTISLRRLRDWSGWSCKPDALRLSANTSNNFSSAWINLFQVSAQWQSIKKTDHSIKLGWNWLWIKFTSKALRSVLKFQAYFAGFGVVRRLKWPVCASEGVRWVFLGVKLAI